RSSACSRQSWCLLLPRVSRSRVTAVYTMGREMVKEPSTRKVATHRRVLPGSLEASDPGQLQPLSCALHLPPAQLTALGACPPPPRSFLYRTTLTEVSQAV